MLHERVSDTANEVIGIKSKEDADFIHECTLKFITYDDLFRNRSRFLRKTSISESNPLTKKYCFSIFMIEEEMKRHINGPYWYIIHPLSEFCIAWERIMLIVYIVNWYVILFQIANYGALTSVSEKINLAIQLPCYVDIVLRFFTGFRNEHEIILDQRLIVMNYLKSLFLIDLIASIPFQVVERLLVNRINKLALNIVITYQALKIFTFNRIRQYFRHSVSFWYHHYVFYRVAMLSLYSVLLFHLAACFYLISANLDETIHPNNSTHPLNNIEGSLPLSLFWYRNLYCLFIMSLQFYCFSAVNDKLIVADETVLEIIVFTVIVFGAYTYHLFLLVKVIGIIQYRHASKIKYQEIMNQLEEYMRTKRLPLAIKNSLIDFYQQRYQYRFFPEATIQKNLSEALRRELTIHCSELFINRIAIFENIPRDVLNNIVSCLKPEIYMPNDLITKAGMMGDCMYFIASGTVSVRATTGQELLHLEDGDHFGEVSLFTKHGKRVTDTIAIEYCELYRLDKSDYVANIATSPDLAIKIETIAMQRMNATITVEKTFNTEQNKKHANDDIRQSTSSDKK